MDDPFIFIRKIFIDYGYSRFFNYYNRLVFVFHTCSLLLEGYYMVKNFSLDFFTQYGGVTTLMFYYLITQFFTIIKQDLVQQMMEESELFFWNMNFVPFNKQKQILKEMTQNKRRINFFWIWVLFFGIVMLPVWGDFNEAHLFPQIYQTYLGNWSTIFYYFHISSFPFTIYTGIRIAAISLYLILATHFQMVLLKQKILQISQDYGLTNQDKIFENLCVCVSQHIALKKFIQKWVQILQKAMPVYICLAILCLITVMYVILNNFNINTSNHLKARFLVAGIYGCVILYTFSEAGQHLVEITDKVFNTLIQCPWYNWNIKNRKTLMMFMLESLQPLQISWAGVTIDYTFGSSVIKTCCSYALVFYKLRNGK
ncbi:odorant receptor 43a-like [Tribolium madens]|uniref:odorant receptor 43a-like n=1 Tax=Tribolium madens TaxID=41895 RepID=UPI001CF743F0|nr:odorant receptor 43a-like [Tribolium madens]